MSNLIAQSIAEHRLNAWYYQAFQRDNPTLAPLVLGYLDGGSRPTDAQLGQNHYARGLVLAEDARRSLASGDLLWEGFDPDDFDALIRYAASRLTVSDGELCAECRAGEPVNWDPSLCASLAVHVADSVGAGRRYEDSYLGWRINIPTSYDWRSTNGKHSDFVEWHGQGSMTQAPFHFGIFYNTGELYVDLHTKTSGYSPTFQTALGMATDYMGRWVDCVLRILWRNDSGGRYQFWIDGQLKKDWTGRTAPETGEALKAQFGIYCQNITPTKTVRISDMKLGTSRAAVAP